MFSVIGHSDFDDSPDLVLTEDFGGVNAGMGDLPREYFVLFVYKNSLERKLLWHTTFSSCPTPKRHLYNPKLLTHLTVNIM